MDEEKADRRKIRPERFMVQPGELVFNHNGHRKDEADGRKRSMDDHQ